jgi:thiamine-monophosphate kinase
MPSGDGLDEFETIARLFRPLTGGAPEALDLMDDAAVIPSRPGFDLVITKDAMVEGVHFLSDDPADLVARKLLRANLSDLAAKAAEPYAYFLAVAWPKTWNDARKAAFAAGLGTDQEAFAITLLGGDTVSTSGLLTVSATLLGWVPKGGMVKRSGAREGDVVLVSGTIGDGHLGLSAVQAPLIGLSPDHTDFLAGRYRLPSPRTGLRETLRRHATAAADVSDGLLADAGHVGAASGLGVALDLERTPLSAAARAWLALQPDPVHAVVELATGGDDYEVVCTVDPSQVAAAVHSAASVGIALTEIGVMIGGMGVRARFEGRTVDVAHRGWTHG